MRLLLELLLEESSTREMDDAVVETRRYVQSLPVEEKEPAARELELLTELREVVNRYRRRSRELRALFETAGDLSSVRDVDGVLQAIVRRGRQLLRTDVAYLMLVDEDRGDTYMRVTEGTTSPGFGQIRLPLGVGLGGRVAQSMAPLSTRDYVSDSRYVHVIDEIVLEEQLVAIVGVPLKVGRRLLGVLFAADRDARDFSQDEISLLLSLGDHAAIAIENAALFQETRDAVAALSSAKRIIEESNRRLQLSVELHERLMNLVVKGGSVGDLVESLVEVVGGVVVVVDETGRELARAGNHDAANGGVLVDLWENLEDLDLPLRSARIEGFGDSGVVTPMRVGADNYGSMVFVGDVGGRGDVDIPTLERSATIMALLLSNERASDEADNRVRGEVLAELLISSTHDVEGILRRARLLRVDLDQELVAVVILPASGNVSRSLQVQAGIMARVYGGLVTSYADRVVLLLPSAALPEWPQTLAARLRQAQVEMTVGVSGPFDDLGDVIEHAGRARRSAKLLRALGRSGQGISAGELGIYGLLLSEASQDQLHAFIEGCLGPVYTYDDAHGTTLVPTLQAYFASEANVAAAAKALFVHVNTLYQRLDRIDRMLGPGWRSGDPALELRLALRMRALLDN